MKYLIYAVILLAGLVAIPNSSQADTVICQYTHTMSIEPFIIYRESPNDKDKDAIKGVSYNKVYYYDGRKIVMNFDFLRCHLITGAKDETEARRVNDFISQLKGNSE